jgi:RNA polymerase sigma-70 factor, ECF subfamily
MSIKEMGEVEIISKIKDLDGKGEVYGDVIKQYYQELYQRYYYQCYNIARYYGLNRHDAEDAVQESFFKLLKSIQSFDEKRVFKPWFFKVVLNSVKDKYRDMKKHRHIDVENAKDIVNVQQEKFFEELHVKDVLHSIIIRLPKKLRSVVILRNYTEMNLESISNTLGLSVRQLHNRLHDAYAIIKKELEETRDG